MTTELIGGLRLSLTLDIYPILQSLKLFGSILFDLRNSIKSRSSDGKWNLHAG